MSSFFFSDDITDLKKPDYANVICRNRLTGRYCYGFKNDKGNLYTGYAFENLKKNSNLNDCFSIQLNKDWIALPIEDILND